MNNPFTTIFNWIRDRLAERTTWDGVVIITLSVLYLMFSPLLDLFVWVALAYGVYRVIVASDFTWLPNIFKRARDKFTEIF